MGAPTWGGHMGVHLTGEAVKLNLLEPLKVRVRRTVTAFMDGWPTMPQFYTRTHRSVSEMQQVMDYVEKPLTGFLDSNPQGLPLPQVKLFMWQLCQAVRYLHHVKVMKWLT